MKYKKGDQFVIEIDDVLTDSNNERVYKIKGFRALVFDDNGLDRLKKVGASSPVDKTIWWYGGFREGLNKCVELITEFAEEVNYES